MWTGLASGPRGLCALPGLLANNCRIDRDLVLSGMTITGDMEARPWSKVRAGVWLGEAEIGGSFAARGTHILPVGGLAIHADRLRVEGAIMLADGFRATGEVRLAGARVTGSLDLIGAEFAPPNGRALTLTSAAVGGSLYVLESAITGEPCRIRGRMELNHTTIGGTFFIRNGELTAPPAGVGGQSYNVASSVARTFLVAPRLEVRGALQIEGDTVIHGGLLLQGAQLRGGLKLEGVVSNPGDVAIDLAQAELAVVEATDAAFEGTMILDNAEIGGPARFDRTSFTSPKGHRCLSAVGVQVGGDVRLVGITAAGGSVNLRGASIGGVVDAADASIENPGDKTLNLHMARIAGNVRLCGKFRSVGLVVLNRMVVDGWLRADGATMEWRTAAIDPPGESNPRSVAVEALAAVIRSGMRLGWTVVAGGVDLSDTTTTALADRPDVDWPTKSYLGGFRYERFAPVSWQNGSDVVDAPTRITWLSRLQPFDPRAWQTLATVLRTAGDRDGADSVEVAALRHARSGRPAVARILDKLFDTTVRYGFRPQRAIYVLLALITAVTITLYLPVVRNQMRATDDNAVLFDPSGTRPTPDGDARLNACGDGKVRCLNPFFYAVDTVVPLIDLHQRSTWYPVDERHGPWLEWWLNICTILGWLASTVFALSFTRLGRTAL